jgi:ribosomal protein L7Ae-like RNA K-turn-binding protein
MIRLVLGTDGELGVDLAGRSFGRGAWVHPRLDCLVRTARGGAAKSFKAPVGQDAAALVASVRSAADRRVESLISSARGAGRVAAGSDVAQAAYERGEASLVVVAKDGRAAAQSGFVAMAGAKGKAVAWGTKERIGRATGRPDTAVVAILDRGIADAITRAAALSSMPEPDARREGTDLALVEVR